MSFEYYVYGFRVKTNMELHMLSLYNGQKTLGEIELIIVIEKVNGNFDDWIINVELGREKSILKIGNNVIYHINHIENVIEVLSHDKNCVESTILNLPFALFFIKKDMLLLHASSVKNKNEIIPICAPKGTGKTTVTFGLTQFYDFFSDDTLLVDCREGKLLGYYGTRWGKLKKDSFELLKINEDFDAFKKNIQNKAYYCLQKNDNNESSEQGLLTKLFFMRRENGSTKSAKIDNIFARKMLLHTNICGTATLGYEYCKLVENNPVYIYILKNCDFTKITISNSEPEFYETIGKIKQIMDGGNR